MQNKKMLPLTDRRALVVYLQEMRYRRIDFQALRYAYSMDGIDDRWTLANRAINPDGDIDIEWYQLSSSGGHIVSQCDSSTLGQRELMLRWNTGKLDFQIGGSPIVNITQNINIATGLWRVSYSGTAVNVYLDGALVHSNPNIVRGIGREPSAPTRIGVRNNGGTFVEFFQGVLYNIKINGVLWPMADRNQTIQPSIPNGNNMTGANLNPDRWAEIPK